MYNQRAVCTAYNYFCQNGLLSWCLTKERSAALHIFKSPVLLLGVSGKGRSELLGGGPKSVDTPGQLAPFALPFIWYLATIPILLWLSSEQMQMCGLSKNLPKSGPLWACFPGYLGHSQEQNFQHLKSKNQDLINRPSILDWWASDSVSPTISWLKRLWHSCKHCSLLNVHRCLHLPYI